MHVRSWDWRHPERWGGDESSLVAAVDGLDWATPRPFDVRRAGYRSLWEHFAGNHPEELLRWAEAVVREQQPDLEPLRVYLRRETATSLYNVFLGRREVLHRYGDFLWPVLAACEPGPALSGYQGRWAGFVAERLHGYWLAQVAARRRTGRHAAARAARRATATWPAAADGGPTRSGVAGAAAGCPVRPGMTAVMGAASLRPPTVGAAA